MFIELHILQNFAPSNLNRDDTNAPKDCTFGGYRRARISSQCIKRSVRNHESFAAAVTAAHGDVGVRTKRLAKELSDRLVAQGRDEETASRVAASIIAGAGLALKDDRKTQYLLYLGRNEIAALAEIAREHWDALTEMGELPDEEATEDPVAGKKAAGRKKSGSQKKKDEKSKIPDAVKKAIAGVFGKASAADIALFGRMVADDKNMNVDAACQVAHAISTNEVKMEMDYYTAIDDLKPDEQAGSDMIGIVQFNSSCFYRYSQVNLGSLAKNLGDDTSLVRAALRGFLEASVFAVPTGKQNSMAAQSAPSYIRVLVRSSGAPWSLANAFLAPARPGRDEKNDLMAKSIVALEGHFDDLKVMYGNTGIEGDFTSALGRYPTTSEARPFQTLVEDVLTVVDSSEANNG